MIQQRTYMYVSRHLAQSPNLYYRLSNFRPPLLHPLITSVILFLLHTAYPSSQEQRSESMHVTKVYLTSPNYECAQVDTPHASLLSFPSPLVSFPLSPQSINTCKKHIKKPNQPCGLRKATKASSTLHLSLFHYSFVH